MQMVKNISLKAELIEAYKSMGKKDLKLLKDWDYSNSNFF